MFHHNAEGGAFTQTYPHPVTGERNRGRIQEMCCSSVAAIRTTWRKTLVFADAFEAASIRACHGDETGKGPEVAVSVTLVLIMWTNMLIAEDSRGWSLCEVELWQLCKLSPYIQLWC